MKTRTRIIFFLLLISLLLLPTTVYARALYEGKVVFGGVYTLEAGETLDGDLVVMGGIATLEEGSTVDGDIIVMGGTLQIDGSINGDVVAIGGLVNMGDAAEVAGNVAALGAHLESADNAQVGGDIITTLEGPISLNFARGIHLPSYQVRFAPFNVAWFFLRILLWAALAVIVILFLPSQTERVSETIVKQPLLSGGLGVLTVLVLMPLLVILAITICLSPVSMIVGLAAAIGWTFGLIAIGYELGKRLESMARQDWSPALSAGLGTLLLVLVLNSIRAGIPCIGWLLPAIVGAIGLGAVLLTRFGTQAYPTGIEAAYEMAVAEESGPVQVEGVEELPPPIEMDRQDEDK